MLRPTLRSYCRKFAALSLNRHCDCFGDRWWISVGGRHHILYLRKLLPRGFRLTLPVPHTGIKPPLGQKALMRAALNDDALVEHDDFVGAHNGRKPMRDHKRGAIFRYPVERVLDIPFGVAVER